MTLALVAVIGAINGFMIAKLKMAPFIATFGMSTIVYGINCLYFAKKPNNSQPIGGIREDLTVLSSFKVFGQISFLVVIAIIAIAAASHRILSASTALVQKNSSLIPSLTVMENIFVIRRHKYGTYLVHRKLILHETLNWMRELGLSISPQEKVCNLTKTEQYLVEILKAYILGAKLIILDDIPLSFFQAPQFSAASAVMEQTEEIMGICDAVLFPGGEDMTPSYYGEDPHPAIQVYKPEIDEALMRAGRYALEHNKPMLGICKGNQLLNVLMGGSLYQDLSLKGPDCIRHLQLGRRDYLTHQIRVEEGTRLSRLLGSGICMTNSMHHQSVKELGKGLRASAYANDGVIEAIEDEEGMIVGVQWHPESLLVSAPDMNRLFLDLCDRAMERKAKNA